VKGSLDWKVCQEHTDSVPTPKYSVLNVLQGENPFIIYSRMGYGVAQFVEALRYKPEEVAGSIPDNVIGIFN